MGPPLGYSVALCASPLGLSAGFSRRVGLRFSPVVEDTMVRAAAIVTVRRGNDFICIHEVGVAREFLGLAPQAVPIGKNEEEKLSRKKEKSKVMAKDDNMAVDVGKGAPKVSRSARKRANRRQKRLACADVLDDAWADRAGVLDVSMPPMQPSPSDFKVGDRVTFCGLVSRPELSGATGTIHSFDAVTGRVAVTVTGLEAIKVRPFNLRRSIFA